MPRRAPNDDLDAYLALLERKAPRPLTIVEMARMLDADQYDRKAIRAGLERAVATHRLRRIGKTRYQWLRERDRPAPRRAPARGSGRAPARVSGRYTRVRAGYGFVEVIGGAGATFGRDVLIPSGAEGHARHGDEVLVEIERRDPRRKRVVGRVVAVTARVSELVVGTIERHGRRWWLVPLNDLEAPLPVEGPEPDEAQRGAIVLGRPGAAARGGPSVTIERVLGPVDDPEAQVQAIIHTHGVRAEFSAAALSEAAALPSDPDPADVRDRRDLRHLGFVTIDGETARDFDDAVCLESAPDGGQRLWVAIADVAHYVQPGSALDAEAAARGTSVYFPDRAVPMLPPALSTELCSLRPERERLVLVAELRYDAAGARQAVDCYRAVIVSRARLTYTDVAAVLSEANTAPIRARRAELAPLLPQLHRMLALMRRLHARRLQAGSLDLDLPEAMVELSEAGRTVGVRVAVRNDAHRIIEELMLEANRAVAGLLTERNIPLAYRIHEPPHANDVAELNELLRPFGVSLAHPEAVTPRDVQRLLDQLAALPLARVLTRQVLRAFRQARYSTENAGHFGLAFPIYCHFTSPIRRYPDLLVHRQLGRLFDGAADIARHDAERLEIACQHSSRAEREAMEAERAMLDLKKAEFMLDHLLEPGPATVVGIMQAGLFVELDSAPIEGLLRAERLGDEPFQFIEAERALKGLRSRQRYRLGDRLEVEAVNVQLLRGRVDFGLVRRLSGAPATKTKRAPERGKPRRRTRT